MSGGSFAMRGDKKRVKEVKIGYAVMGAVGNLPCNSVFYLLC
jgi:hypothetical protein